jgi:hypothetical protein
VVSGHVLGILGCQDNQFLDFMWMIEISEAEEDDINDIRFSYLHNRAE